MKHPAQLTIFDPVCHANTGYNAGVTVYRASAGSGKTYTLTLEYLKQALCEPFNTKKFKELLAVTFTNKAASEMKSRIINTLNNIAERRDRDILNRIAAETGLNAETLVKNAINVRSAILNNYSQFAVSTIDKFFQGILHSFVREAGLQPGFKPETDQARLMDEAVDRMMLKLHESPFLYNLMSDIIDERMEFGSGWDVRTALKEKGYLVFGEQYRGAGDEFALKTANLEFMKNYSAQLQKTVDEFDTTIQEIAKAAIGIIEDSNFDKSDFYYKGSGAINYFYKLKDGRYDPPGTRLTEVLTRQSSWFPKSNGMLTAETDFVANMLDTYANKALAYYYSHGKDYFTAKTLNKSIKLLTFLAEIEKNLKEISGEENLIPISETTALLNKLIDDSDAPFIYERTGSYYSTFMIDEFQDTSADQWANFKPLVTESIAQNNFSMVVGDVKQSIYRWRNGDWRILGNQLENDFKNYGVNNKVLETNRRSKPQVVKFNNLIFKAMPQYVQNVFGTQYETSSKTFNEAYRQAEQKYIDNAEEGYVAVTAFRDDDKRKSKEKILENLPLLIAELQDRGYSSGDIAILVRKATDGQAVADRMLEYKQTSGDEKHSFDIVSHDALSVKRSEAVQLISALMLAINNPDDEVNNAFINSKLYKIHGEKILPKELLVTLAEIGLLSLPEIFEQITAMFINANSKEIAFIQEMHDLVLQFSNRELPDVCEFLNKWADKGNDAKLSSGDTSAAINIITIHKSKGLEYPVVIIPFCDWDMKPRRGTEIWVKPQKSPFNELPCVPVNYGNDMRYSHFTNEYKTETEQALIDNINLMYVAFTRARNELYIMLPLPKETESNDSSDKIRTAALTLENFIYSNLHLLNEAGCKKAKVKEGFKLVFGKKTFKSEPETKPYKLLNNYTTNKFEKKLRLKYESDDMLNRHNTPLQLRNYGNIMHKIFMSIKSTNDVTAAIDSLANEGYIGNDDIPQLAIRINKALEQPYAKKWFNNKSYTVNTGKFILLPQKMQKGINRRPDRVMLADNETIIVDFKFGNEIKPEHEYQIKSYVNLLKSMNYPQVEGYIWYVDQNEVKEYK